jgi:hypothetical protein
MDTLRVCQAESTARQPIRSSNPTNPASTLRIDEWGGCVRRSSQEPGPRHNGTSEDICDDRIALPARPLPFRAGEALAATVIARLKSASTAFRKALGILGHCETPWVPFQSRFTLPGRKGAASRQPNGTRRFFPLVLPLPDRVAGAMNS